jgi:GDP-mannose 6-dehydrogenase
MMNVSLFGLGYVGAVTAGCLCRAGFRVVGVDVQQAKVDLINAGQSPIIEPGLPELLADAVRSGRLTATTDAAQAVMQTEASVICVGTPALESGRLNLNFVRSVLGDISAALQVKSAPHTLILRSTMLPGSTHSMVQELLSPELQVIYCPEFLREGSAVADFQEPSLSAVGTADGSAVETSALLELLAPRARVLSWEAAEMLKYACNYFHALKAGFANEIGRLAKHLGMDGSSVMDALCADSRLNISAAYMRPGNPFGGSCLPKDVSALASLARIEGVSLPMLDSTLVSNQAHLDSLIKRVMASGSRSIGLLGLSFKAATDDLRGSPMVALAETLLGRGYELHIYDPQLVLGSLVGANRAEIQRRIPHLAGLLRDSPAEVMERSDVVVAAQRCAEVPELAAVARAEQAVIDVNGWPELRALPCHYEGLCW